jgi:hypothetical protein
MDNEEATTPTITEPTDAAFRAAAEIAAPVFAAKGWMWSDGGKQPYVPTAAQIEVTLRELVTLCVAGNDDAASGRLIATRRYWRPNEVEIFLSLSLSR